MLTRRRLTLWIVLGALILSLAATGVAGAAPAPAAPAGAPSAAPAAGGTSVATGLSGAFFFALGDDGALYTYDGGVGDSEVYPPLPDTPENPEFPGPPPPLARGLTGRILRVAPDGTQTVVTSGLPSYEGSGVTGLALAHDALWALFSPSPAVYYGAEPYPAEGHLVTIDLATGAVTPVADLAAYERAHNPDGSDVNPNPYGLAAGPDGALYVADAGANDLLRVDPATGAIGVVTVFPTLPATEPNPLLDGRLETQAVPTSIAVAPGGGFYVANLPGEAGAPPPGSGRVVHVTPDGTVSVVASGFTFATGVAVGPDGRVYVAELVGGFGPPSEPDGPPTVLPGRVSRLLPDGSAEVVVDGLDTPNSIAFDRAGNLYVATGVVSLGPPPPSPAGAILRFDGVGAPTAPAPWAGWSSQGGILTDSPAAASLGARAYVFAKGSDNALYVKSADASGAFSGWQNLGGILTAAPAAAGFDGRLYAFAKGSDGALYVKSSADGTTWSDWDRLGGILLAPPAAASANGRLYVFAMGSDKALYVKSTADGATWSDWDRLGGVLTAAPAAAGFQNRIYAFAKGADNALYAKSAGADGVWSDWANLGGILTAAPAAAVSGDGVTLYSFATGTGGFAYERHLAVGGTWTGWENLGGRVVGPPAAASIPGGPLFVFVRWADNALWAAHMP